MSVLFVVVGVLFMLGGLGTLGFAKSAIHEILGMVSLLVAAVLIVGAVITDRMDKLLAARRAPPAA